MAQLIYGAFALLLFSTSLTVAQTTKWFEDNFDDRSKNWYWSDYDGPELSRKILNGKYLIQHKNTSIYWTLNGFYTSADRPYLIETNIIQTEGAGGNGFGIIISGRDAKYHYFLIDPVSKSFWVGTEQRGTWTTLNPYDQSATWVKSDLIQPQNVNNNLKVKVADGRVVFLINNAEVFNSPYDPNFSNLRTAALTGLVTCTPMKIEIDNFIFLQDNPPINEMKSLPTVRKVNLGDGVNSKYTEKSPFIAPDGQTLYYVVQGDPSTAGYEKADDIFYTTRVTDSTWSVRKSIGPLLNNDWPNAVITATPDNNTLYLMHRYHPDGAPKDAGFSITHRTADGWSPPEDLRVRNYYNKGGSNEFCFSADRKVLVMAIQRDDTYGENDLYVSFLQPTGEFSEPLNLGATVNTFAWEASPFLAPDGVTLYYSTAGFPGYGNNDIYMTQRLDSTWTKWSTPLNMGRSINSSEWDAYYTVAASGEFAFVASRQGGIENSLDLFYIKLPQALKPKPVVLVYGKVLNSKTKAPLGSKINYNILSTNKEVGLASSNETDGSYKIVLPAGETYSFLARKPGFYSVGENVDLTKVKTYTELKRDLFLAPIEVGEAIRLNNLFFDFNKSTLRKESFPELERVINLLKENSAMKIEISGHTDNVGSDEVNNKLSNDRATAVKAFLASRGIESERINSKGYGKSTPVAPNNTDEGRQKNRRVEFTILSK
jgi:outer membrane protein OmpA-like peptidoglycan-associated protein